MDLPRPTGPPEIDAFLTLRFAQPAKETAGLAGGEVGLQARQGRQGGGLGRVGSDVATLQAVAVGGFEGGCHATPPRA